MDDKSFQSYVTTNAQLMETETLEALVKHLSDVIALRHSGKPPGLTIGSCIEAVGLEFKWYRYGEVVRLTPQECVIKAPDSDYEERIPYRKYAIRVVEPDEWARIEYSLKEHHAEFDKKWKAKVEERRLDTEEAVRERDKAAKKPTKVTFADGTVLGLYRGAYLHARRIDLDYHIYGVAVNILPKSCYISALASDRDDRVIYTKCDSAELLDNDTWERIDSVLLHRQKEVEDAKKAGNESLYQSLCRQYEGARIDTRHSRART